MKKLLLIISLFIFTNVFGQITVTNTTGNDIEITYIEYDDLTCSPTNTIVSTIGPFGTYSAFITSGTHFAGFSSKCINTGATQIALWLTTDRVDPVLWGTNCTIGSNLSALCPGFLMPCNVTWTSASATTVNIDFF